MMGIDLNAIPVISDNRGDQVLHIASYFAENLRALHDLMSAVHDFGGMAALASIENEFSVSDPCFDYIVLELRELLAAFENRGPGHLLSHANKYPGPDILAAWNFHGARVTDLVNEATYPR